MIFREKKRKTETYTNLVPFNKNIRGYLSNGYTSRGGSYGRRPPVSTARGRGSNHKTGEGDFNYWKMRYNNLSKDHKYVQEQLKMQKDCKFTLDLYKAVLNGEEIKNTVIPQTMEQYNIWDDKKRFYGGFSDLETLTRIGGMLIGMKQQYFQLGASGMLNRQLQQIHYG